MCIHMVGRSSILVANDSLAAGRARALNLGRETSMASENKPKAKEPSFLTKAYLLLYNGVLTVG